MVLCRPCWSYTALCNLDTLLWYNNMYYASEGLRGRGALFACLDENEHPHCLEGEGEPCNPPFARLATGPFFSTPLFVFFPISGLNRFPCLLVSTHPCTAPPLSQALFFLSSALGEQQRFMAY